MVGAKVWLATLVIGVGMGLAGAASAQYRGYGDSYDAAPNYYDGGGGGDRYSPQTYAPQTYAPPTYAPYGDPDAAPPPRYRQPNRGQQGRDQGYDPQDYGYQQDPDGYGAPPRGARRMPYADPLYGRDAYGADPYGGPDGGQDGAPGGAAPPHRASDDDLGENANRTTRTEIANPTKQPPGTIVIDTASRHLYYTQANGQALQYGIGVGRQGFAWKGTAQVKRKSEWPDWIPPSDMLKRRPDLPTRMAGGIENPLGARALYLFQGNKDTLFRIHGTNEPDTIGKAVSSGCIRMMNADVIDLYNRVPVGTKVVVL